MKKKLLFAAIALTAMASCTEDSFVGEQSQQEANASEGAISFDYQFQNVTRGESDHATSAANLGNQFIVWGEKSSGAADTKDAPTAGHIVFPNYQVNYTANTAYNTTSNTKDWEYVGYTHSTNYQSNIKYKDVVTEPAVAAVDGSSVAQTIKYWDYSAGSYTFTAVAAANTTTPEVKHDIENGYITIQKNINNGTSPYNKGYTIDVTANADLTKLYFSDRTIITQSAGTDRNATNAYGGNVTLKFRNALSQVRVGIYETIPGYAISDIHFYVTSDVEAKVSSTDAFGAICPNIKGQGYAGTLTVTYSEETATLNQPLVSASGTVAADLILGTNTNEVTTSAPLGETAAAPTWDTDGGAYTTVLLKEAHTTNMKVKCKYTLYNSVSGETIVVEGATAEVPYQYLQWKPNYKYTYLFKISDNTNGSTGESVVGLYPITFDAVEITNGDGLAEYITTVSEPSITTFGVNSSGKYVHGGSEYAAGSDIYVTIMDGSSVATPNLGTNVNIYKNVTSSDATHFPVTEASLAEAIAETGAGTEVISYTIDNSTFASVKSGSGTGNGIPGEDGNEIINVPAIKLANLAAGTYAVEYIKSAEGTPCVAANGTYVDGTKYYTDTTGATEVNTSGFEAGVTDVSSYFIKNSSYKPAVKVYKIIVVQ